jgi:hypothetical protein
MYTYMYMYSLQFILVDFPVWSPTAVVFPIALMLSCCQVKIVHLVTGDGVGTNDNAMRRILQFFMQAKFKELLHYTLCGWKCASHQANLVIMVAICGQLLQDATQRDSLCGSCVRFFKFLVPDHAEEYKAAMRDFVDREMVFVDTAPDPATVRERLNMLELYGDEVFPDSLAELFNCSLGTMHHHCRDDTDRDAVKCKIWTLLCKLIIKVEERPVVTRFWLFASCVFTFMRMKLLRIPSSLFNISWVAARQEGQRRLAAFTRWYDDPQTFGQLKKATLCTKLAMHATNISAQNSKPDLPLPQMVILGQGYIQKQTSKQLSEMIPLLPNDTQMDVGDVLLALLQTEVDSISTLINIHIYIHIYIYIYIYMFFYRHSHLHNTPAHTSASASTSSTMY